MSVTNVKSQNDISKSEHNTPLSVVVRFYARSKLHHVYRRLKLYLLLKYQMRDINSMSRGNALAQLITMHS